MTRKYLLIILVLATILRFVGLMPNIAHPDEGYLQGYSWDIVNNVVAKGDFNPYSYKYGTWSYYLQALAATPPLLVTYAIEAANTFFSSSFTSRPLSFGLFFAEATHKYEKLLVLFGRGVTAAVGVASVYLIYVIGKKLFNERIGLLSALLLAIMPMHVRDSHYITTDIPYIFFVLLAFNLLINVIQKKRLKDYALSGLFVGISSTVRYLPLAALVYPLVAVFSFAKNKKWVLKVMVGILFIIIGLFVGLPYLFLDKNAPALFVHDLEKYALPWYRTSISNFLVNIFSWVVSGGKNTFPDIKSLALSLHQFKALYSSWIIFLAFGILPAITALAGIVLVFFRSFQKWLLLLAIPLFNFIYISFYVPAVYERLVLPSLPLLAVFSAVTLNEVFKLIERQWGKNRQTLFLMGISLSVVVSLPLYKSSTASLACAQKNIQYQSYDWVDENISVESKIGYLTMVSIPPKNYGAWHALEPGRELSLADSRKIGLDHVFFNAARLDYNTYPFFNSFVITPPYLYENSYYSLIFSEYQSVGKLLGKVEKPLLCDSTRIYYYKIPGVLKEGSHLVATFDFNSEQDTKSWQVNNFDASGEAKIFFNGEAGMKQSGSLEYSQTSFNFSPPRILSKAIEAEIGRVYTFSFWAKVSPETNDETPSIVARLDFYNQPQTSTLMENFKKGLLLINEGPTAKYFEKKRMLSRNFADVNLPGKVITMSSVTELSGRWQKISVTGLSPGDAHFLVLSIQNFSSKEASFLIDEVELMEGETKREESY